MSGTYKCATKKYALGQLLFEVQGTINISLFYFRHLYFENGGIHSDTDLFINKFKAHVYCTSMCHRCSSLSVINLKF